MEASSRLRFYKNYHAAIKKLSADFLRNGTLRREDILRVRRMWREAFRLFGGQQHMLGQAANLPPPANNNRPEAHRAAPERRNSAFGEHEPQRRAPSPIVEDSARLRFYKNYHAAIKKLSADFLRNGTLRRKDILRVRRMWREAFRLFGGQQHMLGQAANLPPPANNDQLEARRAAPERRNSTSGEHEPQRKAPSPIVEDSARLRFYKNYHAAIKKLSADFLRNGTLRREDILRVRRMWREAFRLFGGQQHMLGQAANLPPPANNDQLEARRAAPERRNSTSGEHEPQRRVLECLLTAMRQTTAQIGRQVLDAIKNLLDRLWRFVMGIKEDEQMADVGDAASESGQTEYWSVDSETMRSSTSSDSDDDDDDDDLVTGSRRIKRRSSI